MVKKCNDLARQVYICVDERINCEPVGHIYSSIEGQSGFGGVLPMINQVETLLDKNDGPQTTHEVRTFSKRPKHGQQKEQEVVQPTKEMEPVVEEAEKQTVQMQDASGRQATFIINVRYRQNATWQGKIQWIEEKKEQLFRSTLEMIKLMDEALSAEEQHGLSGWSER